MTPSEAGAELTRVKDTIRQVRRRLAMWRGLAWLGGLALLVAAGIWAPASWVDSPGSVLPMLILAAALGLAVGCGFSLGSALRLQEVNRVAREVERSAELADGELTGALELASHGYGSPELAQLQRTRVSRVLAGRAGRILLPRSTERLRKTRRAAVPVLGAAIVLLTVGIGARPTAFTAGTALQRPWSVTFPPPPPPLILESEGRSVLRGDDLAVRIRAPERHRVSLAWSVPGEPHRSQDLLVSDGSATTRIGPIVNTTAAWAVDGEGRTSDTLRIVPLDPLMVTDLRVRLSYPAYLGRSDEELAGSPPMLTVPSGTRVELSGRTNYPLRRAVLVQVGGSGDTVSVRVNGDLLAAEMEAKRSGRYSWRLAPSVSVPDVRVPPEIDLVVVPDQAPTVEIVYPDANLTLGMGQPLSLVIEARDDHGVTKLDLVAWHESSADMRDEAIRLQGPNDATARHISWRPFLDLASLGMLPGDALLYVARAADAHADNALATTDTFRVRVSTLPEMRAEIVAQTEALASDAAVLEARAEALIEGARNAERKARAEITVGQTPSSGGEPPDFESTEEARQLLREAADLESHVQAMAQQLEKMRLELEVAVLPDPALQVRLAHLEDLYREIMESGLRERIQALEEALHGLERDALRESLGSLAHAAEAAERNLERALGLMERVALEQALKGVRERAVDLAERQGRQAARRPGDRRWAGQQQALEEETTKLGADLDRLAGRLEEAGAREPGVLSRRAGREVAGASEAMRTAQERARAVTEGNVGQAGPAEESARSAAQSLSRAREQLTAADESLARDWRAEAMAAVERATSEALQLAAEQADVVERLEAGVDPRELGGRQAAIREGLSNLTQELAEAGKRSALLDRRSGSAASRAVGGMDAVGQSLAEGPSGRADAATRGKAAAEALDDLAAALVASGRAISGAASGTGMEEALERLADIGKRQAGLNGETGDLFLLRARGGSASDRLAELADRQAELARQLEALATRPETGNLAGRLDELAREADEIARRMTPVDLSQELISRQERLFRRLLDAGRTLERRDEDPQRRESLAARPTRSVVPTGLESYLRAGPRHPYPTEAELEGLTPGQRSIVYDYFDRLNAGGEDEGPER